MVRSVGKFLSFFALLSAFLLSGCGPETSYNIQSKTEEEENSSASSREYPLDNRKLSGTAYFREGMRLLDVFVITLNNQLKPRDTVEAKVSSSFFEVDARDYSKSEILIRYRCLYGDSLNRDTLDLSQYFDISREDNFSLDLLSALISERVKTLHKTSSDLVWEKNVAMSEADLFLDDYPEKKDSLSRLLYLYCGHSVQAPAFGKNFNNLAKALGKKDSWRQVISSADLADSLIGYFDVDGDTLGEDFKSAASNVLEDVYGLYPPMVQGATSHIANDSSVYNGYPVVSDFVSKRYDRLHWRLLSETERRYGPCYNNLDTMVVDHGVVYSCDSGKSSWRMNSGELSAAFFYDCHKGDLKIRFLPDGSEYLCKDGVWSSYGCKDGWCYRVSGYDEYEFDSRVVWLEDECTQKREGEHVFANSDFAVCNDGYWKKINGDKFYDNECNSYMKGATFKLPLRRDAIGTDTAYFYCDGKTWRDTLPPVFYGEVCNSDNANRVVIYNDKYFVCDKGWRLLTNEELIPPVRNLDTCSSFCKYAKYGSSYYSCYNNQWELLDDSLVTAPIRAGIVCDASKQDQIEKIGDEYFICTSGGWQTPADQRVAFYDHRVAHDGECANGVTGTSVYYYRSRSGYGYYFLCGDKDWQMTSLFRSYLPSQFKESELAGGVFIDEENYKVNIGGVDYIIGLYSGWYFLTKVIEGGKTYDASASKGQLFLHVERPKTSVHLDEISDRGTDFETFYSAWQERALEEDTATLNKKLYHFPQDSVVMLFADETSYMDYESAKAFCPAGTHIPDTTELLNNYTFSHYAWEVLGISPIKTTYTYVWDGSKTPERYYNIFWSSTAKDEDTQYCLESVTYRGCDYCSWSPGTKNRVVECPKKTYPLIQGLCTRELVR